MKCPAPNCITLTARSLCYFHAKAPYCLHCGRTDAVAEFPLGRPRADGSRHPMAFCENCIASSERRVLGSEARRRAWREYARRRAA